MKNSFGRSASLLTLVVVGGLAGCSTPDKTAENKVEEEYVYITVTGSNIPKKIKKSDIASGNVPKDVQAVLMDKDEFKKAADHHIPQRSN